MGINLDDDQWAKESLKEDLRQEKEQRDGAATDSSERTKCIGPTQHQQKSQMQSRKEKEAFDFFLQKALAAADANDAAGGVSDGVGGGDEDITNRPSHSGGTLEGSKTEACSAVADIGGEELTDLRKRMLRALLACKRVYSCSGDGQGQAATGQKQRGEDEGSEGVKAEEAESASTAGSTRSDEQPLWQVRLG